jgi:hypothetical protein
VVVDHARLDYSDALLGVDADDLVQSAQGDDDPAGDRQRAARQRRAAAAGHGRDALAVTEADGVDLLLGFGEDDGPRAGPEGGEGVGLKRRELRRRGQQALWGIELA